MTLKTARMMPGGFRCPGCGHIVSTADVCEVVGDSKRKGRRLCFDCGIAYLYGKTGFTPVRQSSVQSRGQRQINLEGKAKKQRGK